MTTNNFSIYFLLIIIQLVIIACFFYIAFHKIKDIESKRLKIIENQQEFDNFIKIIREIIEEYSSVFDLLINDLDDKIKKTNELAVSYRDIEEKFKIYQQRIKIYEDNQLENKNKRYDMADKKKDYNKVIELAEQGLSVTEIAQKLDMGKGEVYLFLNISKSEGNNL